MPFSLRTPAVGLATAFVHSDNTGPQEPRLGEDLTQPGKRLALSFRLGLI